MTVEAVGTEIDHDEMDRLAEEEFKRGRLQAAAQNLLDKRVTGQVNSDG